MMVAAKLGEQGIISLKMLQNKILLIRLSKLSNETQPFFFSAETCSAPPTFRVRASFIKYSPVTQILADHKSSNEVIQKKVMDWPISSQDPVSCTLKKKVKVIPSLIVSATRSRENGGRFRVSLRTENVTASMI
jgi:hypothetical protein